MKNVPREIAARIVRGRAPLHGFTDDHFVKADAAAASGSTGR
jgi:hypothetical protein